MEEFENINYYELFIGTIYINNGNEYIQAGTFIVEEMCAKDMSIIGYRDANTKDFVVNRKKHKFAVRHGLYEYDIDATKPFKNVKGDILWKVSRFPITCVLSPEEVKTYLYLNPNDIRQSLNYIRENSLDIIEKSYSRILK